MIDGSSQQRGAPLWAAGLVLAAWIAARAAVFDMPPIVRGLVPAFASLERLVPEPGHHAIVGGSDAVVGYPIPSSNDRAAFPRAEMQPRLPISMSALPALRSLPVPADVIPLDATHPSVGARSITSALRPDATVRAKRWSGDIWLFARPGAGDAVQLGGSVPVYGASQAGAVLRYELLPASRWRPAAYVRAVTALDTREGDVAAGILVRPLGKMPVALHGEARVSRRGSSMEVRPAGFVSGGVDALPLAAGATARGYAQAGYIGGRDATAFADASLVAERPLWRDGEDEAPAAAGAGAWGGAQRGSARLDLGPTASLRFRIGEGVARLSADYRIRIAGNAAPAGGMAVTLSAGF